MDGVEIHANAIGTLLRADAPHDAPAIVGGLTILALALLTAALLNMAGHPLGKLALLAGVHPKVVSERMGHANVGITLDTYSHVVKGMQEEAAVKVAELLFG